MFVRTAHEEIRVLLNGTRTALTADDRTRTSLPRSYDDIAIALSTPGFLSESDGPSEDCLLKELCGCFIPYTPEYEKDVDVVMMGTAWSLSDYPTQRNLFFLLSFDAMSARVGCARDVEEIIFDRSRPVA